MSWAKLLLIPLRLLLSCIVAAALIALAAISLARMMLVDGENRRVQANGAEQNTTRAG